MSPRCHPCHIAANFPKSQRKASLLSYCQLLPFIALFCTSVVHKWSTEIWRKRAFEDQQSVVMHFISFIAADAGTRRVDQRHEHILVPLESQSFALAEEASLHPTRPGSSFSIVTWAGSNANLPPSALANSLTFQWHQYILLPLQTYSSFSF